jgi:hypothetical protein
MPFGQSLKPLFGGVPDSYDTKEAVNGTKLWQEFRTPGNVNRVRVKAKVTTTGSVGTGTSLVSSLLRTFKLYRGRKADVDEQDKPVPVIGLYNTSLKEALLISKCRTNASARGAIGETDPALAGNATYNMVVDILVNLKKGSFYAEAQIAGASGLAGYSTVPTGMMVSFTVIYIDEGIPIRDDVDECLTIVEEAGVTSIQTGPAREVMVTIAAANAETDFNSFDYDQSYGVSALEILAEIGLARAGSPGTKTVLYKSSYKAKSLYATFSSAKTCFKATIQ